MHDMVHDMVHDVVHDIENNMKSRNLENRKRQKQTNAIASLDNKNRMNNTTTKHLYATIIPCTYFLLLSVNNSFSMSAHTPTNPCNNPSILLSTVNSVHLSPIARLG